MKLDYPATSRNKKFIKEILENILPAKGSVLEIASGSGQHICYFAKEFKHLTWIPSDVDPQGRLSVDSWVNEQGLNNVTPCLDLDALSDWNIEPVDFIMCINMIHISAWEATVGLFMNGKKYLSENGRLYLYGPYIVSGIQTAQSNLDFDLSLKSRNPVWGIRELEKVKQVGAQNGFEFLRFEPMPANNYSVIFQKT
jgi:cyclopropane fatty-acyl-phospholipid synthase-like methyltransferase